MSQNKLIGRVLDGDIREIAGKLASKIEIHNMSWEDRFNEVVLKLLVNRERLESHPNPHAFAWTVGKNHLLDLYRREHRREEYAVSQLNVRRIRDDRESGVPGSGTTLEKLEALEWKSDERMARYRAEERRADLVGEMRAALRSLPARERQIIEHFYGLGDSGELSLAEIGIRCGISAEYARELKGRAIEKLRTAMLSPLKLAA